MDVIEGCLCHADSYCRDLTYNRLGTYDWLLGQPGSPWADFGSLTTVTGSGIESSPTALHMKLNPWTPQGRYDTLYKNDAPSAVLTPGVGGSIPVDENDNSYTTEFV